MAKLNIRLKLKIITNENPNETEEHGGGRLLLKNNLNIGVINLKKKADRTTEMKNGLKC